MNLFSAVLVGKAIQALSRHFKIGGGSAAPGLYALKIYPDLVTEFARQIPKNIIITGTNGKTTTARMLAHFTTNSGMKVIRNHTGSNLERGIASTLIENAHLGGGLRWHLGKNLGIWELDEAAFNSVAPKLNPDTVVFLNVFRDQLDRYGEVDSVIKKWCGTLQKLSPKTKVLINGDDENLEELALAFQGKVQRFGVENFKITGESSKKIFNKLDYEAKKIQLKGLSKSSFQLSINKNLLTIDLPIPGIYHIYDATAAIASAHLLGLDTSKLVNQLSGFTPAFGRMEKFSLQPGRPALPAGRLTHENAGYIFLIKNPVGATQVFETIVPNLKPEDRLLIALNDNLADGTDVSWIWDAQFELLCHPEFISGSQKKMLKQVQHDVIYSGTRAYDLAVRLKYAGFNPKSITVEPSIEKAFKETKRGLNGQLYVIPTYTAMLELQKILTKAGSKQYYWKEEA